MLQQSNLFALWFVFGNFIDKNELQGEPSRWCIVVQNVHSKHIHVFIILVFCADKVAQRNFFPALLNDVHYVCSVLRPGVRGRSERVRWLSCGKRTTRSVTNKTKMPIVKLVYFDIQVRLIHNFLYESYFNTNFQHYNLFSSGQGGVDTAAPGCRQHWLRGFQVHFLSSPRSLIRLDRWRFMI